MRHQRRVVAVAASVAIATGSAVATAHADGITTLYVNNAAGSDCSASGPGTQAAPFCTIQEAANVVVAGDTVAISAGAYSGDVDITSVGTAAAPIVFRTTGQVTLQNGVLNLDGASYVTMEGSTDANGDFIHSLQADSITVSSSSHITLDDLEAIAPIATAVAIHVTSGSSDVTIGQSYLTGAGTGVLVDSGGSGIDVSEDLFESLENGVSVTGTPGTELVSNTFSDLRKIGTTIAVAGGSTGTVVENNLIAYPNAEGGSPEGTSISVDSSSTTGTALDYNVVYPHADGQVVSNQTAYSWAGVSYGTAAALYAATSQGAHDLNTDPQLNGPVPASTSPSAPEVNSADAAAPGMLAADYFGRPCTGDPVASVTGTGSPAFCARGAVQPVFTTGLSATSNAADALSVSLSGAISQTSDMGGAVWPVAGTQTPAVTYTVSWGDGTTSTYSSTDTPSHGYGSAGTYTITDTAELTTGGTVSATTKVTTIGSDYAPYGPARLLDTRIGLGAPKRKVSTGGFVALKVAGVGSIPANATAVAVTLTATDTTVNGYLSADGGTSVSNVNYRAGQTVADSAIVPVNPDGTIDVYNEGPDGGLADVIADVTGYFTRTTASQYGPVDLERILDTRHGIGAAKKQIAGDTGVPVAVAGTDAIPANATAVAVHVTAVDGTGNGWVAAEPDGAGTPTTSILNYLKGQTVSNTVIVPVGTDGRIELYNGGTKTPVDLIADVSGYFSANAPDAYVPVTPYRAVDTRKTAGLDGGETVQYPLGNDGITGSPVIPSGATMVTNITVTNTQGNGYLTVFPAGTPQPLVSNLNHLTGQTVANPGLLNTTGQTEEIYVYNGSSAWTDVIFDVFGYFTDS
jgi:hypothetical protein